LNTAIHIFISRTSAHIGVVRTAVKLKAARRPPKVRRPRPANAEGIRDKRSGQRIELCEYIVADPLICHGKLTYKGTRIMVWQILEALARGESVNELEKAWGSRVPKAAILETIRLATSSFLDADGRLAHRSNGRVAA
jgi:uncharacterized protein (DUF433 family)